MSIQIPRPFLPARQPLCKPKFSIDRYEEMGDFYFRVLFPHAVTTHRRASETTLTNESCSTLWGDYQKFKKMTLKDLKENLSAMQMIQKKTQC